MTSTKLFFHSNIRFLRDRKKMTQEDLCQGLDIARNKLQALESGNTKNPSMADIVKFSEYYKISVDSLLKVDLSKLGELKLKELLAGNDVYMTGSNMRVLAITVDKSNKENVEYVPIKAKAGYAAGYNDPEFIATLPKFSLPNLPKAGTFRIFPTTGDSMLPIPENSEIIGQYIEDWKSIKPDTPCIVVLKGQDFVFKMVSFSESKLQLRSLNPLYDPYYVDINDVVEIWIYYKHQTNVLPSKSEIDEVKDLLSDLKSEVNKLVKRT